MNSKRGHAWKFARLIGTTCLATILLTACSSSASSSKAVNSSKAQPSRRRLIAARSVVEPTWRLIDKQVAVSVNGGLAWTTKALPSGMQAEGTSVAVTEHGSVLAVESSGGNLSIYRAANANSPWTHEPLLIRWPNGVALGPTYDPNQVNLEENYGTDVTAISVNEGGAQTGNVPALFVSDDGGRTFAQLDLPTSYGIYQAAMLSSSAGVITGGNSYQGVWFTPNGGKNWEPASIPGLAPSPYNTVGAPVAFGTQIYVSIAFGVGKSAKTILYASTDGGALFKALLTENGAGSLVAANGPDIWLFNAPHEIVESSNDGLSWTTVSSTALANEVASVELVSPTKAVATTINYGCTGFKTGCYYNTYQQATTNSGKTWTENALGPTSDG